jgi:protein-S-isoprenylcysteine O-methyltransferase Ste14
MRMHYSETQGTARAPIAQSIHLVTTWLSEDCLGGPRPWTLAALINFHKAGTPFFLAFLIWWYGNTGAPALVYIALHGSYGIAWYIKDKTFPDARWQKGITIAGGINTYLLVLAWYWAFGWILIARKGPPAYPWPQPFWFSLCISLCMLGLAITMAADAQKYFTLRLKPGLIADGMFRLVRHPNYLGEMMIYAGFALMVWRPLPFVVLALVWTLVFAVNMALKEASMSRYPEWAAYRARTWWLVPFVF